jgi:hypothetical protein
MSMYLKPQDVLVLLKLAIHEGEPFSYASLAEQLGMSASEVHASVRRARESRLLPSTKSLRPHRAALLEFLAHGLRYVLPPRRGPIARGMPTAHGAPPLNKLLVGNEDDSPVWPDPRGRARGESWAPIYPSAVIAARKDRKLYECLAAVDALRGGGARDRQVAHECLRELLKS